jgi:hypothetical protein
MQLLEHPIVQATSSALTCGLVAMALVTIVAGVMGAEHTLLVSSGLVALLAAGLAGFVSQYRSSRNDDRRPRAKRAFDSHLATFAGASILFAAAARHMGVSDSWQITVAFLCAVICCFGLHVTARE